MSPSKRRPRASGRRTEVLNYEEVICSLLWWPGFHVVAGAIPAEGDDGRPRDFPGAIMLLFAVLSVVMGSHAFAEAQLDDTRLWALAREQWNAYQEHTVADPEEHWILKVKDGAPKWYHWKYLRDEYLTTDEGITVFQALFTRAAIDLSLELGYFDASRGSLSHPHRTQCIQGDGVEIRSAYRSRVETLGVGSDMLAIIVDPTKPKQVRAYITESSATGAPQAIDAKTGAILQRLPVDPDAFGTGKYTGFDPNHNITLFHVRDDGPHTKVTLVLGKDKSPNTEAETAMECIERLTQTKLNRRIRAVIYDKALRGVHFDRMLTEWGIMPIVPVALAGTTEEERAQREATGAGPKLKEYIVGAFDHKVGGKTCTHLLHSVNAEVIEVDFDEAGRLVKKSTPRRGQVKLARRTGKGRRFHFTRAHEIECVFGNFTVWLCPHSAEGDLDTSRAENMRLFPSCDEVYQELYPVRNDTEGTHNRIKRGLKTKRALSLGSNRVLLETGLFSLAENAATWYHQIGRAEIQDSAA